MNDSPPSNNVAAAVCNIFIPGLGQLVQGRFLAGAVFFATWILAWCCCLGFIPHYWSIIDAAVWRPKTSS